MIRTAALAHIRDRRLIQTRSVGKSVFYMAGGKIDPGETAIQALHRETREELGVDVAAWHELGTFECDAYGHPAGTGLQMVCFTANLTDEPKPTSEIAELHYFTGSEYSTMDEVAPGSLMIFRRLHELDLIDW